MPVAVKALDLARDLVRFDTINPPGHERACARHLARLLETGGFAVTEHEFAEGRTSLIARIGGSADALPLCFTGHLDTVPLGARPWRGDALAGDVGNGQLYGRGSSDMKAGLAAFVVVALALAPRLRTSPGLVLVITAGEETGCQGAQYLAGVTGALGRAGAIVIAEPTDNYPLVGHKGAMWLTARASGVTAHASMPEQGVNAIYKAARAISRLETFRFGVAPHPVLGGPTLNVGTFHGGLNANSVPDAAEFSLDVRTIPELLPHAELARTLAKHAGDDVVLEPVRDVLPMWSDPDDPWIQRVFEATAPFLDGRARPRAAPYATDGSVLSATYKAPAVILGPGEAAQAHQTDEYCRLDRIDQAVELYTELARHWCRV